MERWGRIGDVRDVCIPFGPSTRNVGSLGGKNGLIGGVFGGFGWISVNETSDGTPTGLRASFEAREGVDEKCREEDWAWEDGRRKRGVERGELFRMEKAVLRQREVGNWVMMGGVVVGDRIGGLEVEVGVSSNEMGVLVLRPHFIIWSMIHDLFGKCELKSRS